MAFRDQSRDKDKPAADLLRRTLASAAGEAQACPDPDILAAYADRALDADETAHYERHFSQCAHCREQLAALSRAAAPASDARGPRFSWIWTWGWLALAPVTAALLIAAIFMARRPAASRVAGEQPLVAIETSNQLPMRAESAPAPSVPASPEPEVRESARAKIAIPENRLRSSAGSMQRSAADFTDDVKSESDRAKASPAPEEKESALNKPANAPAAQTPGGGVQSAEAGRMRARSGAVTAESAVPATAPTVGAPARDKTQTVTATGAVLPATSVPPPPPPAINEDSSAEAVSGGNASGQPPAAAAKKGPALTASASTHFAASEAVSVESLADRDARTIVRSPDPRILWRVLSGRYVERSSDAGATWRAQWTSVNAHVVAGSAPSVDTCWLVGRGGIVLLSTDGKKWRAIEPPANADFVAVDAADAVSATVMSGDGRKFETSDAGKHWTPAP
jgi:hypothetical protein